MEQENLEWRENILSTVELALGKIPQVVVNAIDAAYVAGLDDRASSRKQLVEEILEDIPDDVGIIDAQWPEHHEDLTPLKAQIKQKFL